MDNQEKKGITNEELLASINRSFSSLESKMVTKDEFQLFKLETNVHFNNIETDLKSFKDETRENFAELKEKNNDIDDTLKNYDKRLEVLETKIA